MGRQRRRQCVITQPYWVAGTPNYPNKIKRARDRTVTPTRILKSGGPVWTHAQLLAAFPALAKQENADGLRNSAPPGGHVDAGIEEIVAEPGDDRSRRFFDAVKAARTAGMTPDDLEDLMRKHPNGCAAKYLEPNDRLRKEINKDVRRSRRS